MDKNIILYGAPGTGKTYSSVIYAVAIIEGKEFAHIQPQNPKDYEFIFDRYKAYQKLGLIEFTTFHQSYGYEEFIEGIRPEIKNANDKDNNSGDVKYNIYNGLFKGFCQKKIPQKIEILDIFKSYYNDLVDFIKQQLNEEYQMRDDKTYLFSINTKNYIKSRDYQTSYTPEELFRIWELCSDNNFKPDAHNWENHKKALVDEMKDRFLLPDFESFKSVGFPITPMGSVFIIDEINRGNISKIFGELITLIEPSKRKGAKEAMETKLPYSQDLFSVPDNVYILGTMNTADRSIALLDTALRRRFTFIEMPPDSSVLKNITINGTITTINVSRMLEIMNGRITALLDREHVIGHSYFLELQKTPTLECLGKIFENKIIPLLQEYFYDDYEKIRLVLGDNQKKDNDKKYMFIEIEEKISSKNLFGEEIEIENLYKINKDNFIEENAYKFL